MQEVLDLKSDLSKIKIEAKFEKICQNQKAAGQTSQLVEKLKSMQNSGDFKGHERSRILEMEKLIAYMEDPQPGERVLSQSTHETSIDTKLYDFEDEDDEELSCFDFPQHQPAFRKQISINSNTSKQSDRQTMKSGTIASIFSARSGSRKLSAISRRSSFSADQGKQDEVHKLSNDEIETVISALLNKEYLLSSDQIGKDDEQLKYGMDIKEKYLQTTQPKNLSDSYLANRFDLPKRQAIVSVQEENSEILDMMDEIGEWNFDTLQLNLMTKREPLKEIGNYVFATLGLIDHFSIPAPKLRSFLLATEEGYGRDVFYHNSIHAADVVNSVVFMLHHGFHKAARLTDVDIFSLIVASICHDIGHPGLNNAFLTASLHRLAQKYNDQSVLENMHCSVTFKLLHDESTTIIGNVSQEVMMDIRKNIIRLILSTDLQKHFEKLNQFRSILGSEEGYIASDSDHKLASLEVCLKCADIGHSAKKLSIHKTWTSMIIKEFFRQGDEERKRGLTVSSLMDRDETNIAESQAGFLSFLAMPIFEVWEEFIDREDEDYAESVNYKIMSQQLRLNIEFWDCEMEFQTFYLDESPPFSMLPKKQQRNLDVSF